MNLLKIYKGWKNYFFPNKVIEELARDRLSICKNCSNNRKGICALCGCVLQAKSRSIDSTCDDNQWRPILYENDEIYLSEITPLLRVKFEMLAYEREILLEDKVSNNVWEEFLNEFE